MLIHGQRVQRFPYRTGAQSGIVGRRQKSVFFRRGIGQHRTQPVIRATVSGFGHKFPVRIAEQFSVCSRTFTFDIDEPLKLFQLSAAKSSVEVGQAKIPSYGVMTVFPTVRNFGRGGQALGGCS